MNSMSRSVLGGCALWISLFSLPLRVEGAEIESIVPSPPPFLPGGFLRLDVQAPANHRVVVERNDALTSVGSWTEVGEAVMSSGAPIPMLVPSDEDASTAFFRLRREAIDVVFIRDEDRYLLQISQPTPLSLVLAAFMQQSGETVFLTSLGDGEDDDPLIPPHLYEGQDPEEMFSLMGVQVWWMPPVIDDDPDFAAAALQWKDSNFYDFEIPQVAPGDEGSGVMADGWKGDKIDTIPDQAAIPPDDDGDMPFDKDVENDAPAPTLAEAHLPFFLGQHLRVWVDVVEDNVVVLDAMLAPGVGGITNAIVPPSDGNLYYFAYLDEVPPVFLTHANLDNPLGEHAYYLEDDNLVHGYAPLPKEWVSLAIPYESSMNLSDLRIVVLEAEETPPVRLDDQGNLPLLELGEVYGNLDGFSVLRVIEGKDLPDLDGDESGPMALTLEAMPEVAPMNAAAASVTPLYISGSPATRINIAILGDGFQDTPGDQAIFNEYVDTNIMDMFRTLDLHPAIMRAFNLYRINTVSVDSGVTSVNSNGVVTVERDTALNYHYSGLWDRCWMEPGSDTRSRIRSHLRAHCPQADSVIIVLNEPGFGGCKRGSHVLLTLSSDARVVAHELGHLVGKLGDEYQCVRAPDDDDCLNYTSTRSHFPNHASGNRPALSSVREYDDPRHEWKRWMPVTRPIPTMEAQVSDAVEDVGFFHGATYKKRYPAFLMRPSLDGVMRGLLIHNPVGSYRMRAEVAPRQQGSFAQRVVADIDGDGRDDLLIHNGTTLAYYRAGTRDLGPTDPLTGRHLRRAGPILHPARYYNGFIPGASALAAVPDWIISSRDRYIPMRWHGGPRTDLIVFDPGYSFLFFGQPPRLGLIQAVTNGLVHVGTYSGQLPGWELRANDEFYVGDFNNDGLDDLIVFNGQDWAHPVLAVYQSMGFGFQLMRRYNRYFVGGFEMGRNEKFLIGDFNGDGRADILAHNTDDWSRVRVVWGESNGLDFDWIITYWDTLPGWQMRRGDQLLVANHRGGNTDGLVLFNGSDWSAVYLGLLTATNNTLVVDTVYDNVSNHVPGWGLMRNDRLHVADVDGNGRHDLVVFNDGNWAAPSLGILRSSGNATLTGLWTRAPLGGWELSKSDEFLVGDFAGANGWQDLIAFRPGNWPMVGLLRSYGLFYRAEAIYPRWIVNHRFNRLGYY
jgi:hypothetical protein